MIFSQKENHPTSPCSWGFNFSEFSVKEIKQRGDLFEKSQKCTVTPSTQKSINSTFAKTVLVILKLEGASP